VLKALQPYMDVDLVSLVHDDEEAAHGADLDGIAATVSLVAVPRRRNLLRGALRLAGSRPLTHSLLHAPNMRATVTAVVEAHRPDVVLALCSGIAPVALEPPLSRIPLVVDFIDVDSRKWAELASRTRGPLRLVYARESVTLGRFEASLARVARRSIVVNEKEARVLSELAPEGRVAVVPSGIDLDQFRPGAPAPPSSDVVFCGVMNYAPNEEAAVWLAQQVWPRVRARRPDGRLKLVGSDPSPRVRSLADPSGGIDVTGRVPDVRPFLWNAAVSAAPLHVARGIQNKVLEAIAAGLPCVVTPVVAEGLPEEALPACVVAESPDAFADALVAKLDTPPAARRAAAGRADLSALTWNQRLAAMVDALESAARS
jgi:sugar transferase (PEP-CTERM/EpsH1 system associated)